MSHLDANHEELRVGLGNHSEGSVNRPETIVLEQSNPMRSREDDHSIWPSVCRV